jgi:hypothetical protein
MSKQNIHNLINFLNTIDQKIFKEVKDLSSVDQNILNKFLSLKENLENLENLENFNIIINQIASETNQTYEVILDKFHTFKKFKFI